MTGPRYATDEPDPRTLADALAFAHRLADAARDLSLRWFRSPLAVDTKADASPVTVADREVERALRELIARHDPAHGVWGEEHGSERLDAEWVWVLDPIDGTASYVTGSPVWGNLIALLWRGRPVLGVVNAPALDERWVGVRGAPTRRNGVECRTSGCARLADARVTTTTPDAFAPAEWRAYESVSRAGRLRRFGGDCHGYGLLASGHVDLVVEAGLAPYDYLALVPVVEGAGGVITDWRGKPLSASSGGEVVAAASPRLHHEALAFL